MKKISNEKYIKDNFDIDELFNAGFLNTKTDFEAIEKRICTFFGFKNIYEWDKPKLKEHQKLSFNPNFFNYN